jgi:hypothetical protein
MKNDENTFHYPHFQQKKVTDLAITFNAGDVRHALTVTFGELSTNINAHDALGLLNWLAQYGNELEVMSQRLDQIATEADLADMARIEREWQEYRNEGLGSAG